MGELANLGSGYLTVTAALPVQSFVLFGNEAGDLLACNPTVGDLMVVPAGTFTQGAPTNEPCRGPITQFTHTLTRGLAVMATEVTQGMWAALRAVQPTLPADPSDPVRGWGQNTRFTT